LIEEKGLRAEVPIIFISVWDETEPRAQRVLNDHPAIRGRYTWITKPFELDFLIQAIKERLPLPEH
jgi:hypothetical protein